MNKETKKLVVILNYLTKKSKGQEITWEQYKEILKKLNFIKESRNKNLFKFFNDNVEEGVNWNEFNLDSFGYSLLGKIELIKQSNENVDLLFNDPIDDMFDLGYASGKNYIDFDVAKFDMNFRNSYSSFMLNLLGLDEYELRNYFAAKWENQGYQPEFEDSDDGRYMIMLLNFTNLEILHKIMVALGKNKLAKYIQHQIENQLRFNDRDDYTELNEIVKTIDDVFGNDVIDNMFNEYSYEVNSASVDSIIEAFENSLPDGLRVIDSSSLSLTYDFFIEFLETYNQINTFADLKNYTFVDTPADLHDASVDYDLNVDNLNHSFERILLGLLDKVESDESIIEIQKSVEYLDKMLKDLKFEYTKRYFLTILNKDGNLKYKFEIEPDDINYKERKLDLTVKDYRPGGDEKKHRIPFDDLPKYVTMEKLFESILSKLR